MIYVYLMINGSDWEDMIIFLSEEEAIDASIKHPDSRIEIFSNNTDFKYLPTYNYYKNGELNKYCNK
jgi:hypothetical protein